MNEDLEKAIRILNNGGIIIFPTDTAYGIGCRIDRPNAVEMLYKIRKRPLNQAFPVLVSSINMAKEYFSKIPNLVEERLMNKYWPGALTIVLPCKTEKVPTLVRAGGKTLGMRMPNNELILKIINKCQVPILGPSANFHNEKTPYSLEEVDKDLISKVDMVLKGEVALKKASTVIDCSTFTWDILRKGAVDINI